METAVLQSIPDILQRMAEVCPVRNESSIRLDSDDPQNIILEWRWRIGDQRMVRTIKISLFEIMSASMDIIQLKIDSLKRASWEKEISPVSG